MHSGQDVSIILTAALLHMRQRQSVFPSQEYGCDPNHVRAHSQRHKRFFPTKRIALLQVIDFEPELGMP